jgi:hypothetical protein
VSRDWIDKAMGVFPDIMGARPGRGLGKSTLELIEASIKILAEIQPASVRAVCYALFVRKRIASMSRNETNRVSRALTKAREDGTIPWAWIVDESREAETTQSWSNPEDIIRSAVRQYRRDYWQDQQHRVEVWSEKGTVRGTIGPVLNEYGITFRVMHGYASATVVNDIADFSNNDEKPLIALYVGDWDPSGKHMSDVDLPRRLDEYGATVELRRISLIGPDLKSLPSFDVETKQQDPRHQWFVRNVGTACYELDAMPPPELRTRVEREILGYIDLAKWETAREVETVERESMEDFHRTWQGIQQGRTP